MKKPLALASVFIAMGLLTAPVFATTSTAGAPSPSGAGNVVAPPETVQPGTDPATTATGTTTSTPTTPSRPAGTSGIGVGETGLPSNLPRLGLQGVTNPVSAVERILLNYVITPIFILAGGVAVIVIMYSAFQIITARGEEEGLSAAKTTLIWAFLGLGLVMLAYTIVSNLARIILEVL